MVSIKKFTEALQRKDLKRANDLVRLGVSIPYQRVWCMQFIISIVEKNDADTFEWLFNFLDDKAYFSELILTRAVAKQRWDLTKLIHELSPESIITADYLACTSESGRLDIETILFSIPSDQDWLFEAILPVYLRSQHVGPMSVINKLPHERRIFATKMLA